MSSVLLPSVAVLVAVAVLEWCEELRRCASKGPVTPLSPEAA